VQKGKKILFIKRDLLAFKKRAVARLAIAFPGHDETAASLVDITVNKLEEIKAQLRTEARTALATRAQARACP